MAELTQEQRRAIAVARARKRAAEAQQGQSAQRVTPSTRRETVTPTQIAEGSAVAPGQIQEGPPLTRQETPRTVGEAVRTAGRGIRGVGDAAMAIGAGGVMEAASGLAGLGTLATGGGVEKAAQQVKDIQGRGIAPQTEEGRRIAGALSLPGQALERIGGRAGEATLDVTGSPLAATAVDTAIQSAPGLVGAKVPRGVPGVRTRSQRNLDINRVQEAADELGVDLNASALTQREQIGEAGQRLAPGAKGDAMGAVQEAMVAARDKVREFKNEKYAQARSFDAGVSREAVVDEVVPALKEATQGLLMHRMPVVKDFLKQAERIEKLPEGSTVHLRAIENWRRSINRNRPSRANDPAQNLALDVMQKTVDNWLDAQFNADAIRGNPEAIQAWRDARRANANYRERFSDNKVIRDMVEMEATPETVRKWVFGASTMGAKSEAASVVKRIKNELGEDSPQITAMRQDALIDIMEPILRPEPDLRGYVRNYDRFVRNNPRLAKELFPDSMESLKSLRDIAQNTANRPGSVASQLPGINRIAGVAMFGHELARKSLTVRAASSATQGLSRMAAGTPRRRAMAEILGYDPFSPMFAGTSLAALGAVEGAENVEEMQGRQGRVRAEDVPTPRAAP